MGFGASPPPWQDIERLKNLMLFINTSYENIFGIPSGDYVGNIDSVVWDKQASENYNRNDRDAAIHRAPIYRIEKAINPKTQKEQHLKVVKWPLITSGRVAAVAGMVVDLGENSFWKEHN